MGNTTRSFSQLDSAILCAIATGENSFTLLQQQEHIIQLAIPFETPFGDAGRVIDRRLQSLRKNGKIEYTKGKWEVTNE